MTIIQYLEDPPRALTIAVGAWLLCAVASWGLVLEEDL